MDVVPANPENWQRDPFKLTVEGDQLFGRGTTDCLGHVSARHSCCWVPRRRNRFSQELMTAIR